MYTYKVAICDDEEYYREEIYRLLKAYQRISDNKLSISVYDSGEKLWKDIDEDSEFQVIILDIEMDEISGIKVAKKIRERDKNAFIIFATSHDEFALDAFDVEASGYLLKPVEYHRLVSLMNKIIRNIDHLEEKNSENKKYLNIVMNRESIHIDTDQILYIEKKRNTSVIRMEDREYCCYDTLREIYSQLDIYQFVYCHQGFLINFDRVKDVTREGVDFGSQILVPVSRKYYKELRAKFLEKINRHIIDNLEGESLQ